jgi:hypothetical protein
VFGAVATQAFAGFYSEHLKDQGFSGRAAWDPMFDVYVLVLLGGAVTWWLYRFTPLDDDQNRKPV